METGEAGLSQKCSCPGKEEPASHLRDGRPLAARASSPESARPNSDFSRLRCSATLLSISSEFRIPCSSRDSRYSITATSKRLNFCLRAETIKKSVERREQTQDPRAAIPWANAPPPPLFFCHDAVRVGSGAI